MKLVLRCLLGLAGLLGLLIAARLWLAPAEMAARLGVAPLGGLGEATLRADMGGFFAAVGGLAVAAAILDRARLLTAPVALVTVALLGRLVTIAASGYSADMMQPMAIEAALVVLLAAGRKWLGRQG